MIEILESIIKYFYVIEDGEEIEVSEYWHVFLAIIVFTGAIGLCLSIYTANGYW